VSDTSAPSDAIMCDMSIEELHDIFFDELKTLTDGRILPLDTPLDDAGLDSMAAVELRNRLNERTGQLINRELLLASEATLGSVLNGFHEQLCGSGGATAVNHEDLSESAKRIIKTEESVQRAGLGTDSASGDSISPTALPPSPLSEPIFFILSSPRSGSSLMQLCFNVHPQLAAGQEITLLMFETLKARKDALEGQFIYGGLAQTFKGLWRLDSEEAAQQRLDRLSDEENLMMWQTYQLLQELSSPQIFVDKTPGNSSQLNTLIRAQLIFGCASYLHLIRHPYACISSGVELARDFVGAADVSWENVEDEFYTRLNYNCNHFHCLFGAALGQRFLQVRYEDFVTDPAGLTQRICVELLSIPWVEAMQNPYSTEAIKSFSGPTAATDPKLLRNERIEPKQAHKWREVAVPQRLKPETVALARCYHYELPDEVLAPEVAWLSRSKNDKPRRPPILCIHDFTGLTWAFHGIAKHLKEESCFGMRCSERLLNGCSDMYQLAARYLQALPDNLWADGEHVRIVAYSLGCRLAYWMTCLLEKEGRAVSFVALDGPLCGDAGYSPRMGGGAPLVAVYLRHQAGIEKCDDPEVLKMFSQAENDRGPGAALRPVLERVLKAGSAAACACAGFIELPDQVQPDDVPTLRGPVLFICPEKSVQRTNGTLEQALQCVPHMEVITDVGGGHFNFVTLHARQVAERMSAWSAWAV